MSREDFIQQYVLSTRHCLQCDEAFYPKYEAQWFCDSTCKQNYRNDNQIEDS